MHDVDVIEEWIRIPEIVSEAIAGLDDGALAAPAEEGGLTIRASVHHIAEANLVAACIIVAGRGAPGCVYDWSWMMPFGEWIARLGYDTMPIGPGIDLMRAVNAFIVPIVSREGALDTPLSLRDTPDGEPRRVTVGDVIRQEIDHARDHTDRIRAALGRRAS